MRLETRYSKLQILEFYLNQVPYGARRRGLVQAASYYFDRDISTLNHKEMLALAVLVGLISPGAAERYHDRSRSQLPSPG